MDLRFDFQFQSFGIDEVYKLRSVVNSSRVLLVAGYLTFLPYLNRGTVERYGQEVRAGRGGSETNRV